MGQKIENNKQIYEVEATRLKNNLVEKRRRRKFSGMTSEFQLKHLLGSVAHH